MHPALFKMLHIRQKRVWIGCWLHTLRKSQQHFKIRVWSDCAVFAMQHVAVAVASVVGEAGMFCSCRGRAGSTVQYTLKHFIHDRWFIMSPTSRSSNTDSFGLTCQDAGQYTGKDTHTHTHTQNNTIACYPVDAIRLMIIILCFSWLLRRPRDPERSFNNWACMDLPWAREALWWWWCTARSLSQITLSLKCVQSDLVSGL